MRTILKHTFCAFLLLCLILPTEVAASRYSPASTKCHATARLILGALEMYHMDDENSSDYGVRQIDREFLAPLVKSNYYRDADSYFQLEKEHNCRHYYIRLASDSEPLIICRQHGIADKSADRSISPREQFNLICAEKGLNPADYNLELSSEVHSDIGGSPLMVHVANFWPAFMILPVLFFVFIIRNRQENGAVSGAYLFGTCIVAFLFILTLISIYYTRMPVPGFRSLGRGSYPDGVESLSGVTLVLMLVWWVVSLVQTIVAAVRKSGFMLSLVYLLMTPLTFFLVESHTFFMFDTLVALSFPLLGALLFYLMAKES